MENEIPEETVVKNQEEQEEILEVDDSSVEGVENEEDDGSQSQTPTEDGTEEETEENLIVTIGEEETPPQNDDNELDTQLVKKLRTEIRERNKRVNKLEKQISEQETVPTKSTLRDRPSLEAHEYDEEAYVADLDKWIAEKTEVGREKENEEAVVKKQEQNWQDTLDKYAEAKKVLKVNDFEVIEEDVKVALNETQQGILLHVSKNSALVVYAIGKSEKILKELSGIQDPMLFAAEVARLETTMKTQRVTKKAPKPESRVEGGGQSSSVDSQLAKLEKEADVTGDRTKVYQYKQKLKQQQ